MSDSMITKKAIAESLKRLTCEKSFDKISISDITNACHLNRQTFYYHFHDKYELLDWIYYNYTFYPLMEDISFYNWNEKLIELLKQMKREKSFFMNTIKCSKNYFQEYLFKILIRLFQAAIDALDSEKVFEKEEKETFSRFYAHGLCGLIMDWTSTGMKQDIELLNRRILHLVENKEKIYIFS